MKTEFSRSGFISSSIHTLAAVVAALLAFSGHVSMAMGQGATAFTYQGQLQSSGTNVNGTNGMIFTLYSSATGNTAVGTPITNSVDVSNAFFTVDLDFGASAFNGDARWLGIGVSNGAAVQELSPRTQVLPTPYATYAATAGIANTASNFAGGIVQASFFGNGGGLTNVGASLQMEVFSSPGTFSFNVPTNVTSIIVEAWGGGGGGGNGNASYVTSGAGGGAGGYEKIFYYVMPGGIYSVLVGSGGVAGGAGGSSGFDGVILATGGSPGNSGGSAQITLGGAGGNGAVAAANATSMKGGMGKYGTTSGGGDGGDAPGGGPGGVGNWGYGAEIGHAPGGGGGGGSGSTGTAGAAGGYGEVIVYY